MELGALFSGGQKLSSWAKWQAEMAGRFQNSEDYQRLQDHHLEIGCNSLLLF